MTLEEAIEEFSFAKVGSVSEATHESYIRRFRYLTRYFGQGILISAIEIRDLRSWRSSLFAQKEKWSDHPLRPKTKGSLSPITIKGVIQAVKCLFRFLHEEKHLVSDPSANLADVNLPPNTPKAISEYDIRLMIEESKENERDHALIKLLADSGLRVGGLVSLEVANLDLNEGYALTKSKGQIVTAHFSKDTSRAIMGWLNSEQRKNSVWLFYGRNADKHITTEGVHRALKRVAERAGVKRYNAHAFRHALAKHLLMSGANMGLVTDVLGHKQISTTYHHYGMFEHKETGERKKKYMNR